MRQKENSFTYAGKTFTPLRKLSQRQKSASLKDISRYLYSDKEMNLSTYSGTYTYADFYKAAGNSDCDLFRCEENKKIYIPCTNELFRYGIHNI